jgi:quercetin dioxygenase-like cupin family protein
MSHQKFSLPDEDLTCLQLTMAKDAGQGQGKLGDRQREKPMSTNYTHFLDLAKEAEPPSDGILSKTIFQDDQVKAVVFGQGQELSEHTAAKPAMLFFVKGEATLGLGNDLQEAQPGTLVHMPANLKHSIKAKTPVVMLLVLLK